MTDSAQSPRDNDRYRFTDPNSIFPAFYSFVPDGGDEDHPNELHYAVFGQNGPVWELRVYPDGSVERFTQTMWDVWMEDKAVGLEAVMWEESAWSDHYFRPNHTEVVDR